MQRTEEEGQLFALFQSLRPVDCEIEAVGRHTAAVVDTRHHGLEVQFENTHNEPPLPLYSQFHFTMYIRKKSTTLLTQQ